MATVTVRRLFVHPVKSLRSVPVARVELDDFGVRLDRRWMVVDRDGVFLTQRTRPEMARVTQRVEEGSLRLSAEGAGHVAVLPASSDAPRVRVRIWGDRAEALLVDGGAGEWLSDVLGEPVRLVYMPESTVRRAPAPHHPTGETRVSFTDTSAVLVASEESLADLNARLPEPLGIERFRPNVVVSGAPPFDEDHWMGLSGGGVDLRAVQNCARCVVTTRDPRTGIAGKEPLRTLATFREGPRGVEFGRYFAALVGGPLSVGEELQVTRVAGG